MSIGTWADLLRSLWDWNGKYNELLPGSCIEEWLTLIQSDYDEVDRFYLESETIGC